MSEIKIQIKTLNGQTTQFKEKILTIGNGIKRDCLIGRDPNCDLVLDSMEVSRLHGRIWSQDRQCFYMDMASKDGSQIDDREVETNQVYSLKPNNLLRIGGFVLTLAEMPSDENNSQIQPTAEPVTIAPSQPRQWSSGELTVSCIQVKKLSLDFSQFLKGRSLDDLNSDELYVLATVLSGATRQAHYKVYKSILQGALEEKRFEPISSREVLSQLREKLQLGDEEHDRVLAEILQENPNLLDSFMPKISEVGLPRRTQSKAVKSYLQKGVTTIRNKKQKSYIKNTKTKIRGITQQTNQNN